MAGQSAALPGTFVFNVLDTMGLISASFGQWQEFPGCSSRKLLDEAEYRYLRLVFDGEQLVGANSIGHTENIGVLRGLIQGRVRLGDWKARLLANPLLLSEAYLARGLAATHCHGPSPSSCTPFFPITCPRSAAKQCRRSRRSRQTTVAALIATWALPPRLVHLVLVNGEFIPPQARRARADRRRCAGHLAADRRRLGLGSRCRNSR
jgi:hypothetical protein